MNDPHPVTPPASAEGPFRVAFDRVRRRTRFWIAVESVAMILLAVAVFFWASMAIDRLLEPPVAIRAAALVALFAMLAWVVVVKLAARLRAPLADRDLAVLVERHHPEFADSLSTAIDRPQAPTDRELLGRTIRAAVERLPSIRLERLFRTRALSSLLAAGLVAVGSVAAMAATFPLPSWVWARRMILLQDQPWPRETSLEAVGFERGVRVVPRGGDVELLARAAGRIPDLVDVRLRSGDTSRTVRMGSRGGATDEGQLFDHTIEGVREDVRLSIRGGDARLDGLLLKVLDPPAAGGIEIGYTLPEYLGGGRRSVPASAVVQVPRGAAVTITCGSTKPLARASITARAAATAAGPSGGENGGGPAADAAAAETIATLGGDFPKGSGRPAGPPTAISGTIPRIDDDRIVVVSLTDTDGLTNLRPIGFRLSAVPDQPPQVALRLFGISTAVTPKARLPFVGSVADDHAIGSAAVLLRRLGRKSAKGGASQNVPETTLAASGPTAGDERQFPITRLVAGSPRLELSEAEPEVVPLEAFGVVVGDLLSVTATAADTCTLDGSPQRSSGDAWNLEVVTTDALVAMLEARELVLRRRFENVFEELTAARAALAAAEDSSAAPRTAEAASRAAGETAEIADGFLLIRREFDNNGLLTTELDTRLFAQIASPLGEIADADLPRLQSLCREAFAGRTTIAAVLQQADAVLQRMRAVLDRMMELETFNEVVELLRSAIRTQEEIRQETLKRQKERARRLLDEP